jgi:hypothetical protein
VPWRVEFFPKCRFHVFLSHSREDHDELVRPVYDRLVERRIAPWIDRHHYPYGADSRSALQQSLVECRHTVFFVTESLILSSRGWCVLELAYAELLQRSVLAPSGPLSNIFLPLLFIPQSHALLPRTVWQAIRDRGNFHDTAKDLDPVAWACAEIERFLKREQQTAAQLKARARRDGTFRQSLPLANGLRDRITKFEPQTIPEE